MKGVSLRCLCVGLLLLVAPCLQAAPLKLERLTVGPRTYTNVTILGASETDLYFTYSDGIANVRLAEAPKDLQEKYNFDPKAAAAAEHRKEQEDASFYKAITDRVEKKYEEQQDAARKAANTSPESFADPVSEQSLLGKKGPELKVQKWLTDKPALEGKYVLLVFWEPWSIPCQKAIEQWNRLQQTYGGSLAVVGVISEAKVDLDSLPDAKPKFACALDTTTQLRQEAGATSVPFALLVDPNGVVAFQGNPAALDDARLKLLLAKTAE